MIDRASRLTNKRSVSFLKQHHRRMRRLVISPFKKGRAALSATAPGFSGRYRCDESSVFRECKSLCRSRFSHVYSKSLDVVGIWTTRGTLAHVTNGLPCRLTMRSGWHVQHHRVQLRGCSEHSSVSLCSHNGHIQTHLGEDE